MHETKNMPRLSVDFSQRHMEDLAANLREMDKIEIEKGIGIDPLVVIKESVLNSWWKRMAYLNHDGVIEPIAIGGISHMPDDPTGGIPWMLATDKMDEYPRLIMRIMRSAFAEHSQRYTRMENFIHVDNTKSILFLKHLGFEMDEPAPWGVQNAPFIRFHWSK